MNSQKHRPRGYKGIGDRYLPRIERELKRFLIKTQHDLRYDDTLGLPNKEWAELAGVLVEFMEDIHNDIGIWKSLEQYQLEFFKTPLVKNLINDQSYRIRMDHPGSSFKAGQIVFGSLVSWEGDWYWSGEQKLFQDLSVKVIQEIQQTFVQKMPTIAYRYCRQEAERARESISRLYREFVKYHGDDLVVYLDGRSMAADMQELYRQHNEALAGEAGAEEMAKRNLLSLSPSASFSPELLEQEDGLAVYFNAGEGQEMMTGFNDVVRGLKKRGQNLTEDETEAIYALMNSDAISPDFVRRLVKQHGDESIASAFLIDSRDNKTYLDYLLRRYKGHFYRNRYPQVTLV